MKKSLNNEIVGRCNALLRRMNEREKPKSPLNERIKEICNSLARCHIPDDDGDDDYSRLVSGNYDGDDDEEDEYSSPLNSIPSQLEQYTDYERGH